jgi:DNA-directed RNA polymerase subunit alpha
MCASSTRREKDGPFGWGGNLLQFEPRRVKEIDTMRIRWRGLELPSRVIRDQQVSTDTYGRFSAEPFERGFGTTVGNSLRRILLSSLEGAAVTHIKLKGADQEFSSLPGVLEDVTDIILNVKSLIVKLDADEPKELKLSATKAGPITAGMITGDPAVTIINKDLVIATLTEAGRVRDGADRGQGPRLRHRLRRTSRTSTSRSSGSSPVDSIYSPVTRVRYSTGRLPASGRRPTTTA